MTKRLCSRTGCARPAMATLTFAYSDQMVVIGPLAATKMPGAYDLCAEHARTTTPPQGWEVLRVEPPEPVEIDEIDTLAGVVRSIGMGEESNVVDLATRRHLRVVADDELD